MEQSFSVKADQTITFTAPSGKTFGDADFDPGASSDWGLPVTYTSSTPEVCTIVDGKVHLVGPGTCTVKASQAGNDDYHAASNVERSFTVADPDTDSDGVVDSEDNCPDNANAGQALSLIHI